MRIDLVIAQAAEGFLEAAGMALLSLRESLEPIGDLVETLVTGGPRHARVHIGVFVGLARDRGLQIVRGLADRLTGCRIPDFLEKFQMAVGVAGLAFGSGPEHGGDIVVALDIGLLCEIEIATVGLAFAGERLFEIFLGL